MKKNVSIFIVVAVLVGMAFVGAFSLGKNSARAQQSGSIVSEYGFDDADYVQVTPKDQSIELNTILTDYPNRIFRIYGDSVLNDTVIYEELDVDSLDGSLNPNPNANLNIGYANTSVPDLARMQVDGNIKVSGLDTGDALPYCVCADEFGTLTTCGRYDPANGLNCTD